MSKVYLVGAGPGDPDLITLKGRRILELADSVLYDYLANAALVDLAARAGRAPLRRQEEIGARLHARRDLRHAGRARAARPERGAAEGRRSFIFGRGGEEAEALAAAGVAFESYRGLRRHSASRLTRAYR